MTMHSTPRVSALICCMVLLALAVVPVANAAGPDKLTVGHLPAINSGALYIALENGYFRDQNIEVELQPFGSLTEAAPLLATGQLAAYGGGTGLPLYNAILRGIPIKAVADKSHEEPGYPFKALVVRRDTYNNGAIRAVADMKGRRVTGLNSPGSQYQLDLLLRTAGLTLQDVEYVGLGLPEGLAALTNGAVEASFTFEPFLTRSRETVDAVTLMTEDEVKPGLQGGVINYGSHLLQDRDLGRRFMVAYVKGIRTYMAALEGTDRDAIVTILQKYSGISDRQVYEKAVWGALYTDGHVNTDSLLHEQAWYVARGDMPRALDASDLVDEEFWQYASQVLGPSSAPQPTARAMDVGSAIATQASLVAYFEVAEPLHCASHGSPSEWPPLCVVVTGSPPAATGADAPYTLAVRVDYRPELTHLDAEEVWVRTYDGKLDASSRGAGTPVLMDGLVRMTLTSPLGMAAISQAHEQGSLGINLTGVVPGTSFSVRLVDRLPP